MRRKAARLRAWPKNLGIAYERPRAFIVSRAKSAGRRDFRRRRGARVVGRSRSRFSPILAGSVDVRVRGGQIEYADRAIDRLHALRTVLTRGSAPISRRFTHAKARSHSKRQGLRPGRNDRRSHARFRAGGNGAKLRAAARESSSAIATDRGGDSPRRRLFDLGFKLVFHAAARSRIGQRCEDIFSHA